jgi:hypothetical protein
LKNGFVQKVAIAVRSSVSLYRVVSDMLATSREQHAVDVATRSRTDQMNLLIDLGKSRSHGSNRPLDVRVLSDSGSFVSKMPSRISPIL